MTPTLEDEIIAEMRALCDRWTREIEELAAMPGSGRVIAAYLICKMDLFLLSTRMQRKVMAQKRLTGLPTPL